jgi:hypothetical protein
VFCRFIANLQGMLQHHLIILRPSNREGDLEFACIEPGGRVYSRLNLIYVNWGGISSSLSQFKKGVATSSLTRRSS